MWKYSEIIREIDNIFDYFKFHNKNLTKKQLYLLADLQNLVHDLRRGDGKMKSAEDITSPCGSMRTPEGTPEE